MCMRVCDYAGVDVCVFVEVCACVDGWTCVCVCVYIPFAVQETFWPHAHLALGIVRDEQQGRVVALVQILKKSAPY